jgi:hypothetical protein
MISLKHASAIREGEGKEREPTTASNPYG